MNPSEEDGATASSEESEQRDRPIWAEKFSSRFKLQQMENGIRLVAAPEKTWRLLHAWIAVVPLIFFISVSISQNPVPMFVVLFFGMMPLAQAPVIARDRASDRSAFPRVRDAIEIRTRAIDDAELPYRQGRVGSTVASVVIDGHEIPAERVEGARLLKWREEVKNTRVYRPRGTPPTVFGNAILVLVVRDDAGKCVPYEVDVFFDESTLHYTSTLSGSEEAEAVLGKLLGTRPKSAIELPMNTGLNVPPNSLEFLFFSVGSVLLAFRTTSTWMHLVCVAVWVASNVHMIRWLLQSAAARRNEIAPMFGKTDE